MEDSELTRKAIEELMKEMDEYKEKESMPTERKKNPLGRPNKLFLGRTIDSMMKHNKRQTDRNLKRCERKLKELDARKRKHKSRKRCTELEYSHEVISDDSTADGTENKLRKKRKKRRRKKKYRSSSSSSSSSSTKSSTSSEVSPKIRIKSRQRKRHKSTEKEEENAQEIYDGYTNEPTMGYYIDPNMAYAVMAYNQMNHMMQQQQIQQQVMVEKDLEESIEIPSDLTISCHSSPESSLNISLNSSSAEEDENGVLTFKVSSDDEKQSRISQNANKNPTVIPKENGYSIDGDDKGSVHSHISLESKDSKRSVFEANDEIFVLSSSDSDVIEIVETATKNISN